MDIQSCLIKLGYKAVVWGSSYEGIKPHELETRPIPSLAELEAVWPQIQTEMEAEKVSAEAKAKLEKLDLKSIRSVREWVVKQPDAPLFLKDCEEQAVAERAKIN
jgi:hypothetical protein